MKIDDLMKMVEEDFTINFQNYDKKVFEVPGLHSKYLNMLLKQKRALIDLDLKLKKKYRELYYYYKTEYKYVLETKAEYEFHIYSDESYMEILKTYNRTKAIVEYLDNVVKKASQLSFDCKNIVAVISYQQGV